MARAANAFEYPTSDGRPIAETDIHRNELLAVLELLQRRHAGRHDVYVTGTLLLCYDPADPNSYVCPDLMVVFGVEPRLRDNYLLWQEKAAPAVVFEITSKTTRREDVRVKKDLYLELGVREYYVFDPTHDYLRPPLQGWHASAGQWVRLHGAPLRSPSLGLHLRVVEGHLRFFDIVSGDLVLLPQEEKAAEAQRAEAERQRADSAQHQLDAERQRADSERRALQEENARLLRRLAELEGRRDQD